MTTLSRPSDSCDNPVQTMGLIKLLPSKCIKMQIEDTILASIQEVIKLFEGDLPSVLMIPKMAFPRSWYTFTTPSFLVKEKVVFTS